MLRYAGKLPKNIVSRREGKITYHPMRVKGLLGPAKFPLWNGRAEDQIGAVTGLAWTEVGGDTLIIEVTVVPGTGNLTLTGKLGDVMKESAQAAFSYTRSKAAAARYSSLISMRRMIFIFIFLKERFRRMDHLQGLRWQLHLSLRLRIILFPSMWR